MSVLRKIENIIAQKRGFDKIANLEVFVKNGFLNDLQKIKDHSNSQVTSYARILVSAADHFDKLGKNISVAHLENAIEKLSALGVSDCEIPINSNDFSLDSLVLTSDLLDKRGLSDISNDIDLALDAVSTDKGQYIC